MSLVLAESFLKSSPKCLLACVSSGTRGKIQNWGFFGQKVLKNCHFCQKSSFWRFWLIASIFVISYGWKLLITFSLVSSGLFEYLYPCENSKSGIFLVFYPKVGIFLHNLVFWFLLSYFKFGNKFGWKLVKTFSLVPSSVFDYLCPFEKSETGFF